MYLAFNFVNWCLGTSVYFLANLCSWLFILNFQLWKKSVPYFFSDAPKLPIFATTCRFSIILSKKRRDKNWLHFYRIDFLGIKQVFKRNIWLSRTSWKEECEILLWVREREHSKGILQTGKTWREDCERGERTVRWPLPAASAFSGRWLKIMQFLCMLLFNAIPRGRLFAGNLNTAVTFALFRFLGGNLLRVSGNEHRIRGRMVNVLHYWRRLSSS